MEKRRDVKKEAIFQIAVLVIATIAFTYFVHQSVNVNEFEAKRIKINPLLLILKIVGNLIFSEKGLVSAESNYFTTCLMTKNGESCKGYAFPDQCSAECETTCLPNPPSAISECKLGTCYDDYEGTCLINSPRGLCEKNNGTFIDDPYGNVLQCRKGCCVLGDNAMFITERSCYVTSDRLGIEKNFKPEIRTEIGCLAQAHTKEEGACLIGARDSLTKKANCVFTRKEVCLQSRGEFHSGFLCSNPELETKCEKQRTTNCVENKDEIYWFDSCGNRENIYEGSSEFLRGLSWNDGKVKLKENSCSLAVGKNYLANQKTCGNCNYLLSSRCGNETTSEHLSDLTQNVVCRSLTCTDENGKTRANGETWCVYQGDIGKENEKGVDTPGSRHFKRTCIDGEVATESCGEYRANICVESKNTLDDGRTLSVAECIKNLGDLCITYNTEDEETVADSCNDNPFCFVKETDIDDDFDFNLCVPKYPVGHKISTAEGSSACALATLKCVAVKTKTLQHGWEWTSNEDCTHPEFTEKMNDLCMSLGDCGAEANYEGVVTDHYKVKKAYKLGGSYLSDLKKYADVVPGKVAEMPDTESFGGSIGIPDDLEEGEEFEGHLEDLNILNMVAGGVGGLLLLNGGAGAMYLGGSIAPLFYGEGASTAVMNSASMYAGASFGALAGAAIGFALTTWLITATGIEGGLPPAVIYTLIAMGTVGGACIGWVVAGGPAGAALIGSVGWVPIVGWALVIIVILAIIVFKAIGIGETKEYKVHFYCYPWEAPSGGKKCETCGKDGLPCSEYACEALGQTCKFVNEGTSLEKCIDIAPNDITPPVISPWHEILSDGLHFENISLEGLNGTSGVYIRSNDSDGCIAGYSMIRWGVLLDKYGMCRYSTKPNIPYDDMLLSQDLEGEDMGDDLTIALQKNVSQWLRVPSLEMLGYSSFDVNRRVDYNMYIKCKNGNGYASARDYAISMCVKPGNDTTAPKIEKFHPAVGRVMNGVDEQPVEVWTNEPAECKWSIQDKDYDTMESNMTCANKFDDQELFGWGCTGVVPLPNEKNSIYVRCMDKPWENETTKRNKNSQSTQINLDKTTPLEITSATPDGETITAGFEPVTVKVEVRTSGGYDDTARCSWSTNQGGTFIDFYDTLSTIHIQDFQSFSSGDKTVNLRCEDIVGNTAWKNISFTVKVDAVEPKISRIYYHAGSLVIKTNENAECRYSDQECNFEFVNGTAMGGTTTEHRIGADFSKIYYIKCKDPYGNAKGECDAAIKVVGATSQGL